MARQGFMAPAPSHSSSSRDVAAGNRTFTHHVSTVSSLHRIADANIAVEGLRNTYDIQYRSPCPTPIAQRKQTSLVGKAFETREHSSAFQIHRHVLPPLHSGSSIASGWPFNTKISFEALSPTLTAEPSTTGGKPIGLRAAKPARLMLLRHAP